MVNPHATTTQPPWIKDMIPQIQPHHVSESPVSENDEDVSVFWDPDSTATDPFAAHSPSNTTLPGGLPLRTIDWKEFGRTASICTYALFHCTDAE